MKIELLDSRRLTGPNLYWGIPGAVLDISIEGVSADKVIQGWEAQVRQLMESVGWDPSLITARQYRGGASLVIHAPIDVLYAACEANEMALANTIKCLQGEPPSPLDQAVSHINQLKADECNLALLALQAAAARYDVPFLWDDDECSLGFGRSAQVWPARQLPDVSSIHWQQFGSIPLGIVTGTNGKSTTVRLAASILACQGWRAGVTSTDYIRVGEKILEQGDFSGPGGARTLLRHPDSEAVVLEVARGGLLRRGIGVERADAALITNIAADHLGDYGIHSVAEMAEAKFIVRRALATDAPLILNADDPESVSLASTLDQRVIWFGLNPTSAPMQAHLSAGGDAAYLEGEQLMLQSDGSTRVIANVDQIPVTFGGAARYNVSNSLAAMLLCHCLGATDAALGEGLAAFSGDADSNPGRGNLFEKNGIRILLDFAHNEHGVKAVAATVNAFDADRNVVLMGQAGDREDKDIADLVAAVSELSPGRLLVCGLPGYERGRSPMETAQLIAALAKEKGIDEDATSLFANPIEGVQNALENAQSGDCLLLLALTQRDEVIAMIRDFVADN